MSYLLDGSFLVFLKLGFYIDLAGLGPLSSDLQLYDNLNTTTQKDIHKQDDMVERYVITKLTDPLTVALFSFY